MNYKTLIGEVTEYLHTSTKALSKWLSRRLPEAYGVNWWTEGVLERLSIHQQENVLAKNITTLSEFDLPVLLRISNKNWYAIRQRFFLNQSSKTTIGNMFSVRNNWKHTTSLPPDLDTIIMDLTTLVEFMTLVEVDTADCRKLVMLINNIKREGVDDAQTPTPKVTPVQIPQTTVSQAKIKQNDIVHLISDPNTVGVVMGTNKIGDKHNYTVFINGKMREFFEGQIEIHNTEEVITLKNITEVRNLLTAYQIQKPSFDTLYSLNTAKIDFVPYQFRPAIKIIKSDEPKILIADSVGVGKTIEAGLILKEMQARTNLDSVMIICPKPLVAERKWEREMREKFDEDFTPVDGELFRCIINDTMRDGELPDKYKRLIIPYSLFSEENINGKKDKRGYKNYGLKDLDPEPIFDMVIVDEAHHVRNSNTIRYEAVRYFCEKARIVVFLTATPVQMGNNDLYTLLNLLQPKRVTDKDTFEAMAEPNPYINKAIHFLRTPNGEKDALNSLNSALTTEWGKNTIAFDPAYLNAVKVLSSGEISREQRVKLINDVETLHTFAYIINRTRRQDIEDFCVRRPYTLKSDFTERQSELHNALLEFNAEVMNTLYPTMPLKFLMCTIRRQAASCIFGLAPFIEDMVNRGLEKLTDDMELEEEIVDSDINTKDIHKLAKRVISLAKDLPIEDDKFDKLAEIICKQQELDNNKIIIFSTFRHTVKYLKFKIEQISGIRVEYIDGDVKDEVRREHRSRFELPKTDPAAFDILIFTEVGSEGLDYQFCDKLVNYDIPWNPMRIEQRIGRIDRRGQKSEVAHIYNCITHGTIDEEIHDRCLTRIGVFEQSIGDCSEILGNIATSINEIVLDVSLTETERAEKLEHLADNEFRNILEIRKLEDEGKHMFGLDISSFTEDIEKSENPWVTPESIKRLVTSYLENRLGIDKSRFSDNKYKLTQEEKSILLEDLQRVGKANKDTFWSKFLKSSSKAPCSVAYCHDNVKDNKTLLVTPIHPLVRQAAEYFFSDKPSTTIIELKFSGSDVAPGEYRFQFYIWEYTGKKPRTKLFVVCNNDIVQNELPQLIMENAFTSDSNQDYDKNEWSTLSERHSHQWQIERDNYISEVQTRLRSKIESLSQEMNSIKKRALHQMEMTAQERIHNMRRGQIDNREIDYIKRKKDLENEIRLADIHATLLVNGVLIVKEG